MSFNRPSARPDTSAVGKDRPTLWVEGSQQPRLDLRAFARVSLVLSRRAARPVLLWLDGLMSGAARRMEANTLGPRLAAMGRLGRALPARTTLAHGLSGVAWMMNSAADVAVPQPVPDEPPAYPDLLAPVAPMTRRPRRALPRLDDPAPAAQPEPEPERPALTGDFDAPTLAAIRALIDEMRSLAPLTPQPDPTPEPPTGRVLLTHGVPLSPPEPREKGPAERLAAQMATLTAAMFAWLVIVLALPVGATRALMIHLGGEDLRDWS